MLSTRARLFPLEFSSLNRAVTTTDIEWDVTVFIYFSHLSLVFNSFLKRMQLFNHHSSLYIYIYTHFLSPQNTHYLYRQI